MKREISRLDELIEVVKVQCKNWIETTGGCY